MRESDKDTCVVFHPVLLQVHALSDTVLRFAAEYQRDVLAGRNRASSSAQTCLGVALPRWRPRRAPAAPSGDAVMRVGGQALMVPSVKSEDLRDAPSAARVSHH